MLSHLAFVVSYFNTTDNFSITYKKKIPLEFFNKETKFSNVFL